MAEQVIKTRIKHKVGTAAEWQTAATNSSFAPLKGELIIYEDATTPRMKIGDGSTLVTELPFVDGIKISVTGSGNAITAASYDENTRTLTLTKGASYTSNTGDITGVTAGNGLTGGATSGTATLAVGAGTGITVSADAVAAKLRSTTALTVDSAAATTTSGRVYPVAVDKTGYLAVNVPWTDTNTDTNTTYTFATGSTNGTFTVTPSGGTAQSVAIKGLGSNAYTSTAYLPLATGGTVTGTTIFKGKDSTTGNNVNLYMQDYSGTNKLKITGASGMVDTSCVNSYGSGWAFYKFTTGIDGDSRGSIGLTSSNQMLFNTWTTSTVGTGDVPEVYQLPVPTATTKTTYDILTTKNALSYTTSGKNYKVQRDSTTGGLYVNVPWTDTTYTLPTASSSTLGGVKIGSNINISSGTISVPTASDSTAGVTIVYPAANCTTYTSDAGTCTPKAVKQAVELFAEDYCLPLTGGNISGHVYFTGSKPASSTDNTSQIVFGTSSDQHVAISSNDNALVINPSTTQTSDSTTGSSQIVLYLNKASSFPKGISANVTGNLTGTASKATADGSGNNIVNTYCKKPITYHLTTGGLAIDSTDGSHETYASIEITETSTGESLSSLSADDTIIADVDLSAATADTIDSILDDWGTVDRIEV